MQEEWIDIRKQTPPPYRNMIRIQMQVPCYFDCAKDGTALRVYVPDRFVDDNGYGFLYSFPVDLTDKERKWKWKLNKNDEKHYEDWYAWAIKHPDLFIPDNYHYYRRQKDDFKTFKKELPMSGTSIILQFETKGHIFIEDDEYCFMEGQPHFMCGEMRIPLRIHLEQNDLILKWKECH